MRNSRTKNRVQKKNRKETNYHCPGCRNNFNGIYNSPSEFVKKHMELGTKECRDAVYRCECCNKSFMNRPSFHAHLSKTNHRCNTHYKEKARNENKRSSYAVSQVKITDLSSMSKSNLKNDGTGTVSNASMTTQNIELTIDSHLSKLKASDFKKSRAVKRSNEPAMKKKKSNTPDKKNANVTQNESTRNSSPSIEEESLNEYDDASQTNIDLDSIQETTFFTDDADEHDDIDVDNSVVNYTRIYENQSYTSINDDTLDSTTTSNDNTILTDIDAQISNVPQSSTPTKKLLIDDLLNMNERSKPPSTHPPMNNNNPPVNDNQNDNEPINNDVFLNENLLLHIKSIRENEIPKSNIVDVQYEDGLKLLKYLLEKDISLSSYEDLMKWKHGNQPLKYYSLKKMKNISSNFVYGSSFAHLIRPKKTILRCPSGRSTSVITSDAVACVVDLLSDLDLTDIHNTTLSKTDEVNPFVTQVSNMYSDIHQGELFISTQKEEVNDSLSTYHVGLILYQDEATLDAYSKLSFHPINLTLTLYNREARNLSMTWRTIAYLPNFEAQVGGNKKYNADEKLNDFHYVLNHVLTNLRSMQSNTGLNWNFTFKSYPNKIFPRKLIFRFSHIISDAKENDMICGRMSNRSKTTRLCRDCDILVEESDDPTKKCNFLSMYDIQRMNAEGLKNMSFKKIEPHNAFRYMNFGNNPYGINGATPAEPLHQILGGVVERLPSTLLDRLSEVQVKLLDNHASLIAIHFSRQSDRDFYSLRLFKNGISSVSKLTSKEKASRLLIIYLTLLTTDFEKEVCNKRARKPRDDDDNTQGPIITRNEYNAWVLIFEETMILVQWVYLEEHPKAVFKGGRKSVAATRLRSYMELYKSSAYRKTGMGLKILKFHQISHLWWIIRIFGSLLNVDSGRGEHSHKKKKKIGSHTQKRVQCFNEQTAHSEYVNDTFLKAMKKIGLKLSSGFEMITPNSDCKQTVDERREKVRNKVINQDYGSKFFLIFDYEKKTVTAKWCSSKMKKKDVDMPIHVLDSIYKKYEYYNHGTIGQRIKSIECFTQLQIDPEDDNEDSSILFRACPSYRNSGSWFDWAIINWGEYGYLEGQLLLFMNFGSLTFEEYDYILIEGMNQSHDIIGNNRVALVHSTVSGNRKFERRPSDGSEYGTLVNRLSHFKDMEKEYNTISVENISQPCAVYVDKATTNNKEHDVGCAEKVIVLTSMREWYRKFIDYESQELLEEASQIVDEDYPVDNDRHLYEG